MSQRTILRSLLSALGQLEEPQRQRILAAKCEIEGVIATYGDDGMMALAILGLEGAVAAEDEEAMRTVIG